MQGLGSKYTVMRSVLGSWVTLIVRVQYLDWQGSCGPSESSRNAT